MDELNNNGYSSTEQFMVEFEAANKKGQIEYKRMLRKLCPSQEMRLQAKRLSNRKYPCVKCAYLNKETWKCNNPHEDMYNPFIDVDHCYEGILRQLVKEAEATRDSEFENMDAAFAHMAEALDAALDMAFNNMNITRTFARWIIMMTDGNCKLPRDAVNCVRETLDLLNDIMPEESETYEADGQ